MDIASPIILRLDGTNAAEGTEMLRPHLSDKLRLAPDMVQAARMAVTAASAATADGPGAAAEPACCPEPTCCEEPGP